MRGGVVRRFAAAAVVVAVAAAGLVVWRDDAAERARLEGQQTALVQLELRVGRLETAASKDGDWTSIAARVEPSVFTVESGDSLGSAWVAQANAGGSELVTNYHVIASAWTAGASTVTVRQRDRTIPGTIYRVDPNDDLALVHVAARLEPLAPASGRPRLGATVMAVGSPLGLEGSVSLGIVAGYRSLAGSDYMQFSAPISPGSSGGPVVDSTGAVVAVASAKLVGDGVEALSLAIPVAVVCQGFATCTAA